MGTGLKRKSGTLRLLAVTGVIVAAGVAGMVLYGSGTAEANVTNDERTVEIECAGQARVVTNKSSVHSVNRAFDGSLGRDFFWEHGLSYPVSLDVYFQTPIKINGYSLGCGENCARMPASWIVAGNVEGSPLAPYDQRRVTGWKKGMTAFPLAAPITVSHLAFSFQTGMDANNFRLYEIGIDARGPDGSCVPQKKISW